MSKDIPIRYVTDEAGNKKAVQIPFEEWEQILELLAELEELRSLRNSLKTAFQEVEDIKKGKSSRITLSEFLDGS